MLPARWSLVRTECGPLVQKVADLWPRGCLLFRLGTTIQCTIEKSYLDASKISLVEHRQIAIVEVVHYRLYIPDWLGLSHAYNLHDEV